MGLDEEKQIQFNAFPNPCVDVITISGFSNDAAEVVLVDISGKIVLQQKLPASMVHQINLATLQPGVYILRVGNHAEKVIKN